MKSEIWKDIKNYEGYYQISNKGRVKSLNRIVPHSYSGKLTLPEKILKLHKKSNGYYTVSLCKNTRKGIRFYVHRLIAEAFIPNPQNYIEINHIDGNGYNNSLSNLEWCTHSYNMNHAVITGLKTTSAVDCYTKDDIFLKRYINANRASVLTGIPDTNIYKCLYGKRKSAGGFKWVKV